MERTELWSATNQRGIPKWLPWLVVVLVGLRIAAIFVPHDESKELIRWTTPANAQRQAAASKKLIMYDFSAAWCGPCRQMERAVFQDERLAGRINGSFVPVHVVDRQQEDGKNPPAVAALQTRYNIRAFPTIVLADADGRERSRMEGFSGKIAFERVLLDANAPAGH